MRTRLLITAAAFLIGLSFTGTAVAHYYVPRHHQACARFYLRRVVRVKKHHHRHTHRRQVRCYAPRRRILHTPASAATQRVPAPIGQIQRLPTYIELGNIPGCVFRATDPKPYLDQYGATVLRVVVSEARPDEDPLPCIRTATDEGFHIHIVLQWRNADSPAEVADFVQRQLAQYGAGVWALGLGNEQELNQDGSATPQQYSDDWAAAEPVAREECPSAILVAGDISPWGMGWLEQAWTIGLPHAQALGAHPYAGSDTFAPATFLGWAKTTGLAAWFDEALSGPHAWGSARPIGQMTGAQLAGAWWDGTPL